MGQLKQRSAVAWSLIALAIVLAALQVASIYTEAFNWDEVALGYRAERTEATGVMHGGGRPGLAVALVVPFVDGCTSAVDALRSARLLWALLTFGYLAGFFFLLRTVRRDREFPWHGAALGVALLVLVPVFLRWSIQVRTDHIALLGGVWGGVALLASRRRAWLATFTGVAMGIGFLGSQKVIYVAALVGLLALADLFLDRKWSLRDQLHRLAWLALGGVLAAVIHLYLMPLWYEPQATGAIGKKIDLFAWYRKVLGYRVYRMMLPSLIPHLVVGGLLVAATVRAARSETREGLRVLAVAWAVIALGLAIALVHAAAFPYFWMTLGLFPATAAALAWEPILELFPKRRVRALVVAGIWALLVIPAVPAALGRLHDSQEVQRASYEFIDRAFGKSDRGYHVEGALFCREDEAPMPSYFSQHIVSKFSGPDASPRIRAFLGEFVKRPITFMVQSHRMNQFPDPVHRFWASHYIPYYRAVYIPGRYIGGVVGAKIKVNVIVPGNYRWVVFGDNPVRLRMSGSELAPNARVALQVGGYEAEIISGPGSGMLVYDVGEPADFRRETFFSMEQIRELSGVRQ